MTPPASSSRDAAQALRDRLQGPREDDASWRSPGRRGARLDARVARCLHDLQVRWSVTADVQPLDPHPAALWIVRHRELRALSANHDDGAWVIGWHPHEYGGATIDPDWLWSPDGAAVRSVGELRIGDREQIWVRVLTPVDPQLLIVSGPGDGSADLRRLAVAARDVGRHRATEPIDPSAADGRP